MQHFFCTVVQRTCTTWPLMKTDNLSSTTKEFFAGFVDLQTSSFTRFKPWFVQCRLPAAWRTFFLVNTVLHCKPSFYKRSIMKLGKAIIFIYSTLVKGTFGIRNKRIRFFHFCLPNSWKLLLHRVIWIVTNYSGYLFSLEDVLWLFNNNLKDWAFSTSLLMEANVSAVKICVVLFCSE